MQEKQNYFIDNLMQNKAFTQGREIEHFLFNSTLSLIYQKSLSKQ
jgi:hypothetical protein